MNKDKGINGQGAEVGGTPAVPAAPDGEGISTRTRGKIIRIKDLTLPERTAANYWAEAGGSIPQYLELWNGDRNKLALLQNERVKKYIEQEAEAGNCVSLIASKDELCFLLTTMARSGSMDAIKNLGQMKEYYPKESGGINVGVQLVVQGSLGD